MTSQEAKEIVLSVPALKVLMKAQKDLEEIIKIQCSHGNWNYDPYMLGMANGLILAKSCLGGDYDPAFLSAPAAWLKDRTIPADELGHFVPEAQNVLDNVGL